MASATQAGQATDQASAEAMIRVLTEPGLWLAVTVGAIAVVWPRRSYYCRCHSVKLGTRHDQRVHGESPFRLRG